MEYSGKRSFEKDEDSLGPVSKKRYNSEDIPLQVFNDPVHGFIQLHPLLVKIIHTPQFQRLKDIKQLGVCYWVFPGASHNRFEHSLGTAFLCGRMIDTLQELHRGTKDPNQRFEITDIEALCVKVAGLCHDMGHGPFSHFFDGVYIPHVQKERANEKKVRENEASENGTPKIENAVSKNKNGVSENKNVSEKLRKWSHEDASCELFDVMIKDNPGLKEAFERCELGENEQSFIKELIQGKDPGDKNETVERICQISGKPKWFLYEIVSNKRNGIDCDKFDYFARDCFNVGVKSNFDFRRYFQNIRIIPVDGQLQICVRDKEVFNLYELFHTRWSLHHRVYQHKTHAVIEHLLTQALLKVDKKLGISSAIHDMRRYSRLTDSIIYDILRNESEDKDIKEAQALLVRIQRRELYKFCGQTQQLPKKCSPGVAYLGGDKAPGVADICGDEAPGTSLDTQTQDKIAQDEQTKELDPGPNEEDIAQEMASLSQGSLEADQVFVSVINIHFGMKHKDPVDSVVFFNKLYQPMKVRKKQVSQVLPSMFHERYFRVYAKSREHTKTVQECFEAWCRKKGYPIPHMLEGDVSGYFSPAFKSGGQEEQGVANSAIHPRNLEKEFEEISQN